MVASRTAPIHVLGPQRLTPTVGEVLRPILGGGRPAAAITAGWEERESEHGELGRHLGRPVEDLELYRRAEALLRDDPALLRAWRRRRDRLRELRALYRLRLRHLAAAADELLRRREPADLLEPEREAAFASLRALDAHHLGRVGEIAAEFREHLRLAEHETVVRHRREIAALLEPAGALCVAGGHVEVLHDCLWLFDVQGLLPPAMPVVAWSAGAMALAERIVLFHDSPPQGRGWAEVLGSGLGLCPGVVFLPHARRRLQLDDRARVQLLSRRFSDALCVALDEKARIAWDGRGWSATAVTMRLAVDGTLVGMTPSDGGS